ncbi:hypothetical protein [Kitasatospora sp. NBC_01300]|uniref:hypothetical protein n=1 Tax=Kitasatospora sp. NBC_01300 TaxID=2903574 RepID=UPI002F914B04|nr:hypothetical protein OG556_37745 [Kitasatospora sp. NBC_01300]
MQTISLDTQAREHLERAAAASSGRSAATGAGDLIPIPEARHSVEAIEDSAVLLTIAKRD